MGRGDGARGRTAATAGFRAELQRLKDTYNAGCDFPPREEDLKGGRPIAA